MIQPIVSVVVPCYNQGLYLKEALESVLLQSYNNWECIIVNDGSTDNSEEIALKFCEIDSRFKYLYKTNEDVSAARNFGIEKAIGKYILPLDGDDKIAYFYLEEAIKVLEDDNEVKLVYCEAEFFGDKSGHWVLEDYSLELLLLHNIIFVSALFRKADWAFVGGFDTEVNGAEDWEFWISLLKRGGKVIKLPVVGFYYRQKSISKFNSLTKSDRSRHVAYVYNKHADLLIEVFGNPIYLKRKVESLENQNMALKEFQNRITSSSMFKVYEQVFLFSKKLRNLF